MDAAETAVRGPSAPALVARMAALVAGLVGLVALLGWIADIQAFRSVMPGYATMKAYTFSPSLTGGRGSRASCARRWTMPTKAENRHGYSVATTQRSRMLTEAIWNRQIVSCH